MAEFEFYPDEQSRETAEKLAQQAINSIESEQDSDREGAKSPSRIEQHADELKIDAPLRDVEFILDEFAAQWHLLRAIGEGVLSLRLVNEGNEVVPVSMPFDWPFGFGNRSWRSIRRMFPFPYFIDEYREILRTRRGGEGMEILETKDALGNVRKGLGEFLSYRISGYKAWVSWMLGNGRRGGGAGIGGSGSGGGASSYAGAPPPPPVCSPGGGINVEVSCRTSGLALEFSHSYFVHFMNFGAPSSPVTSSLPAGRYIFKGTGPMSPGGTSHSQVFRIPPDYKCPILIF